MFDLTDVMSCSVAFEYLVLHAVNRSLVVFVSPVEKDLAQSVCSCFVVNELEEVVQPH